MDVTPIVLTANAFNHPTRTDRGTSIYNNRALPEMPVTLQTTASGLEYFNLVGVEYHESGVGMGQSYWYETFNDTGRLVFLDKESAQKYADSLKRQMISRNVKEKMHNTAYAELHDDFVEAVRLRQAELEMDWYKKYGDLDLDKQIVILND